jgi:hypothetical protein
MQSIDLIRDNLKKSRERVLAHIEEMPGHGVVFPTPKGGCHTLWVLGHLAYIEALVIRGFMLGEGNPLADWEERFDGADTDGDLSQFPPFDQVLAKCREVRQSTLALLDSLSEEDLDKLSANVPAGFEDTLGTYRLCLQYVADQLVHASRTFGRCAAGRWTRKNVGVEVSDGVVRREAAMNRFLRFPTSVKRDPDIDDWMTEHSGELGAIALHWFEVMRKCGRDVRELLHDGHPVACVEDAAFAYVNAFKAHVNVGFFRGAEISDPEGLLEGTGKFMRHVKIRPERGVNATALMELIDIAYADMKERLQAE